MTQVRSPGFNPFSLMSFANTSNLRFWSLAMLRNASRWPTLGSGSLGFSSSIRRSDGGNEIGSGMELKTSLGCGLDAVDRKVIRRSNQGDIGSLDGGGAMVVG